VAKVTFMTKHPLLVLGGVLGALGVGLGAFGAHALKATLEAAEDGPARLAWWHTATQYHLWHALLIVALGVWAEPGRRVGAAGISAAVGILLFSGSLYAMTLTGIRALGAVTPLGGAAFILAWVLVALAGRSRPSTAQT